MPRKPTSRPPEPTKEQLAEWYVKQGKSIAELAKERGASYYWWWRRLELHGIPRRPRGQPKLGDRALRDLTKRELRKLLIEFYRRSKGRGTLTELAKQLGADRCYLSQVLSRKGLKAWELRRLSRVD